jgi:hypothetical protein
MCLIDASSEAGLTTKGNKNLYEQMTSSVGLSVYVSHDHCMPGVKTQIYVYKRATSSKNASQFANNGLVFLKLSHSKDRLKIWYKFKFKTKASKKPHYPL